MFRLACFAGSFHQLPMASEVPLVAAPTGAFVAALELVGVVALLAAVVAVVPEELDE